MDPKAVTLTKLTTDVTTAVLSKVQGSGVSVPSNVTSVKITISIATRSVSGAPVFELMPTVACENLFVMVKSRKSLLETPVSLSFASL